MKQTSPRKSRVFAVALLAAVLVLLFLLVEPLWMRYLENEAEIATLSDRLSRYQRVSSQREALQSGLEKMLLGYQTEGYLLKSGTEGLAVAELQSTVRDMVDRAGGRLISTQVVSSRQGDNQGVKVRVKTEADIGAVQEILEAIETSPKILLIDNVTIQRNRGRRYNSRGNYKSLRLNFDLTAFASGDQS
jgi:hypothetical protein